MRLGKASDMSSASKKAEKYENINKIQGRMSEKKKKRVWHLIKREIELLSMVYFPK